MMNKKSVLSFCNLILPLVILVMGLCMVIVGCGSDNNKDKNLTNEDNSTEYSSDAGYYFDFEKIENLNLKEQKSGSTYNLNYIFSQSTVAPNTPKLTTGIRGNALLFDGYSTYSDTCAISSSDSLTVSVWLAPRAFDTRYDKASIGVASCLSTDGGFELGIGNYGKITFKVRTNKGTFSIISDEGLDLYKWNYVTAVFDGSTHKIFLYKNSEKVGEGNALGDKYLSCSTKLRIGCLTQPGTKDDVFTTNIYSGLMDELEIYPKALTTDKIKNKYSSLQNNMGELDIYEDLWLDYSVLANDPYAPQYHLRTSQNWQNETYGFFYYNGLYHAFCQQNPLGPYYTEGQRWGHFVSEDLVHWKELIPALAPEPNGIDNDYVFSGCATLDKNGNPLLLYTGVCLSADKLNQISTATPTDITDSELTYWTKSEKVVVAQGDLGTKENFRDPFVYQENGIYYMLIGSTDSKSGNGTIYCYKAKDDALTQWEYVGVTYKGDRAKYAYLGNCYELPNLFKISDGKGNSKYMLMFSPIKGTNNGVYYLVGNFNTATGEFTPEREEPYKLDYGPTDQVLCPSGFYDANTGRNLLITMSRTGDTAEDRLNRGWTNVMTLIKEITLGTDGLPRFTPIEEYDSLYSETLLDVSGNYSVQSANALLENIEGDMLKIEIEVKLNSATKFGMYVKYDASGRERVDINYQPGTDTFGVDASKSSTAMKNNGSGKGVVDIGEENLILTVYVDRSMIEAYINGRNQGTCFGYNVSENSNGILLYSTGTGAEILSLKVYRMSSAFLPTT